MSYQVLARKWRPKNFNEVVGQKHVLQALVNALDNNRLHHAYLFSGTRGVGKTTLGRIFAKSLNCENGISATPCGTCLSCTEIDEGRFVDLLEVDAASRTKVDETRELLENVQYAPSRGRFKVYLIDEVHMLTSHSFNALLKTLEEPPPHVKFVLATTDPQKLPVTILSRCLKFNLKTIPQELITEHMSFVLNQENIQAETSALKLISRSAKGSMRDALSLLDQAIAHGNGQVEYQSVCEMLGSVDNKDVVGIIRALINHDAHELLSQVHELASHGADFSSVLSELISVFHLLAIGQTAPDIIDDENRNLVALALQLSAEDVQLYYQIALMGQSDLPLAPDPRAGFEMVLLRMYAFQPENLDQTTTPKTTSPPTSVKHDVSKATVAAEPKPNTTNNSVSHDVTHSDDVKSGDWGDVVNQLPLSGLAQQLANHCVYVGKEAGQLQLMLAPSHSHLNSEKILQRLEQAVSQYYGEKLIVKIQAGEATTDTPAVKQEKQHQQNLNNAVKTLEADPNVIAMKEILNAKLDPQSVKLVDKN